MLARNEEFLDDFVGVDLPAADVQEATPVRAPAPTTAGTVAASFVCTAARPEGALPSCEAFRKRMASPIDFAGIAKEPSRSW